MGPVRLRTIAREWGRIGVTGFGGPPAHIALLRDLCVTRRGWLSDQEFADGIAVTNLLPGPASTQLAIFCAWRLRGPRGALVGGASFIVPGLVAIVALAAVFLDANAPAWVLGAAAGAGAAVPAVAVHAALGLIGPSWRRAGQSAGPRARWAAYGVAGAFAAVAVGPWLVLVLLACGLVEVAVRSAGAGRAPDGPTGPARSGLPIGIGGLLTGGAGLRGLGAVAWLAVKVGALSYGGGFVIVPLMQHDAVDTRHIMTDGQFLTAVALGQITPGPVVQTVAVVGFAAAGLAGAAVAAVCAFTPSFLFVCLGAPRFDAIRRNARVQAFLSGAGPAAIGAIAGSAVTLALGLHQLWQYAVLAGAAVWLLGLRRGVVSALLGAAAVGVVLAVR